MAHRFDSFKWRCSKLLSPQYEILVCVQYNQRKWPYKDMVPDRSDVNEKTILEVFPDLDTFQDACEPGGELFKVFVLTKFNRRCDEITEYVTGVLDKSTLLKYKHKLLDYNYEGWDLLIEDIEAEVRRDIWYELDFSKGIHIWLGKYVLCTSVRWTMRDHPNWRSARLRNLLHRWKIGKIGNRMLGKWERAIIQEENNFIGKGIWSPILLGD